MLQAVLLIGASLSACVLAGEPVLSKAEELAQSRDFVARLTASSRNGGKPVVGVLSYWNLSINTYSEDPGQRLKRAALYPLYYGCCRAMERLYKGKPITYLSKDKFGYPSQITMVNFEDKDSGKSHLVACLWEGNDSTGFFFRHLPGSYELDGKWERRASWNIEGVFFDAKKPAEQAVPGQPANRPGARQGGGRKPRTETEGRFR